MNPQILILIIVIAILVYAFSSHGKKELNEADFIKEQFKRKKEASANEDVVSYGQVQDRKKQLLSLINEKLSEYPIESSQLTEIVEDWAELKIEAFQNRRSWVRATPKDS